jgi:HSP20 family protein
MKQTSYYPDKLGCLIYPGDYEPLLQEKELKDEVEHFSKEDIIHPSVFMKELIDLFELEIAIPGVKREEFFIQADENDLSIIVLHQAREENNIYSLHGINTSQCFDQHIRLPENVDAQFASAEYAEGILYLHLSKTNRPAYNLHTRIIVYRFFYKNVQVDPVHKKMDMKKLILASIILTFCASLLAQENNITAVQAINYVGKTVLVCDRIDEAALDNISRDEPTVLYTGTSFDNRTLALVFSKEVLATFSYNPTAKMINHKFCVHGRIKMYKGKPAVFIKSESQIQHIS